MRDQEGAELPLWRPALERLWETSRGRIAGTAAGLGFGYVTIRYGLLAAMVLGLFTVAGYLLGRQLDERGETLGDLLDRMLPRGHG